MLPLNDLRWSELCTRNGDAAWVPRRIATLLERPDDLPAFQDLWPWLCSEGTAWSAAYAAVPYVVELAKRLPPDLRFEHIYFVGLVVMCSGSDALPSTEEEIAIKPYLLDSYRSALREIMPLLAETLICEHHLSDTRLILAAAAALKGHPKLGDVLNRLDCISGECPKCGECVFPEELQEVAG